MAARYPSAALRPLLVLFLTVSLCAGAVGQEPTPSTTGTDTEEPETPAPRFEFSTDPGFTHYAPSWAGDGTGAVAAQGCGRGVVNDVRDLGRLSVQAWIDDVTRIDLEFQEFSSTDPAHDGGIVMNSTLSGSGPGGQALHPPAFARAAGWGLASLHVNERLYLDPITGQEGIPGFFMLLDEGIRDNATKALMPQAQAAPDGTKELHVVLASTGKGVAETVGFQNEEEDATGRIKFAPNYYRQLPLDNTKYRGVADIEIEVDTASPAVLGTELKFEFARPDGRALANVTLTPTPGSPARDAVSFPLDQFGAYFVTVSGRATLASYRVVATLSPPDAFWMNFWWEDVLEGQAARDAWNECGDVIDDRSGFAPRRNVPHLAEPPGIRMEAIVLGVVGAIIGGLLLVKLAVDARTSAGGKKR